MPTQQFEYLILKMWDRKWQDSLGRTGETPKQNFTNDDSNFAPVLTVLGAEGWELVCNAKASMANERLIFKRPRV